MDRADEGLRRLFGRGVWSEMREDAARDMRPGYGLDLVARKLVEPSGKLGGKELELHAVGHSTGAIKLGHLLERIAGKKHVAPMEWRDYRAAASPTRCLPGNLHCMASGLPASLALALALTGLAGCATPTGEPQPFSMVVVPIDTAQVVGRAPDAPRRTKVEVTDIRKAVTMERTALGASLGRVELKPPAPELVRAVVQAKADEVVARLGLADPPLVLCGIRVFDITTPSTPIYWDLDAKIELVLRVRGQDRTASGAATDRTYVWPTEALISNVTTEALKKLATETERALTALLEAR